MEVFVKVRAVVETLEVREVEVKVKVKVGVVEREAGRGFCETGR